MWRKRAPFVVAVVDATEDACKDETRDPAKRLVDSMHPLDPWPTFAIPLDSCLE
jgi:hypothetical protein